MVMSNEFGTEISPAESVRHTWSEEENRLAREYDLQVRKMELDILKIENRWSAWFRIPLTIIKLPVYIVMAIAYGIAMARGVEPSENFWTYLK